ncbi:(2E,6E)-farnesyl diphosphate synthase [Erwinia tasmaniensis]|uniref:Geranyltranstransferase n=1 Tax=Erwinia tasmaniensis (strain DSM 17950 / CFBP 7177 / CIP 109463 / NCPPB 4357 / Et1/99) TaxID=465817 RepID=B2VHS2_ERWT9|nr:(2E,6E)-farnesyl diphosphate synthase [Erwinia tasmaniensis]CAO97572.1 Geranyltranstransferase [Erwinia tasmaniensis Et1/99]
MDFNVLLTSHYQRVNAAIQGFVSQLPFQSTPLVNAIEYGALLGGKRLRPFLVYATGNMLHADDAALDAPAAAVECIHAYSLIHDDLPAMDNDSLRRGQPTCHIKFGEDAAILAGDALQTLAFSILADAPMPGVTAESRVAMLSELAQASGVAGMCGGQALDLAAEGKRVTLDELEQIHRHKTGALIRSAVRLGALSAGAPGRAALPALDRFADAIGLAFQVQDDILDVIGDTVVLGKQQGADQQLGKSTYPALMGLENARLKAWDLYQESLNALETLAAQSYNTTALRALASFIIERDK